MKPIFSSFAPGKKILKSSCKKRLPERMLYRNLKKEINKNLYYRLTDTVSYLFGRFRLRTKQKYKGMHAEYIRKNSQLMSNMRRIYIPAGFGIGIWKEKYGYSELGINNWGKQIGFPAPEWHFSGRIYIPVWGFCCFMNYYLKLMVNKKI